MVGADPAPGAGAGCRSSTGSDTTAPEWNPSSRGIAGPSTRGMGWWPGRVPGVLPPVSAGGLGPATWPGDLARRPGPATWPGDPGRRPGPAG